MNLYEFQAKKLFLQFDLPVLKNQLFFNLSDIDNYISKIMIGPPWIVKCQIRSGGRGKAGGIAFVSSKKEIIDFAEKWIHKSLKTDQTDIDGEIVNSILIEPAVKVLHELYISILLDRELSQIIFLASKKGGVDIENLLSKSSTLLHKVIINPITTTGHPYEGRIIAYKLGLQGLQIHQFVKIYVNMIRMFFEKDLTLLEINPLGITDDNNLICLDAKVSVDNNALFRQSKLLNSCLEYKNQKNDHSSVDLLNINYVGLNGNIGCMVNGAGLAMATMDLMKALGGSPANFLDIGGDTDSEYIQSAFKIMLDNKKIRAIFVNIFGGIVCCKLVANSIISALSEYRNNIPIVVRLEGNNASLGFNILNDSHLNIVVMHDLFHAIKKVITLVK